MSAQHIASKHGLALARVSHEPEDDATNLRLLKKHISQASMLELLVHVGVVIDFALIDTNQGGEHLSDLFDTAVAENRRFSICLGSDDHCFIMAWTKRKFKDLDEFVNHVFQLYKRANSNSMLSGLPQILRGFEE